jgi:hypothetical protein
VPVVFEVTGAGPDTGAAAARFAPQFEQSTFFVPRQ